VLSINLHTFLIHLLFHYSLPHISPANSETHFKVVIVASKFETIPSLVERHRLVNTILAEELKGPVHALSIVAKTPNQWLQQNNTTVIEPSPACRGGDGSLPPKNNIK
jgi:BolA-like protein 1